MMPYSWRDELAYRKTKRTFSYALNVSESSLVVNLTCKSSKIHRFCAPPAAKNVGFGFFIYCLREKRTTKVGSIIKRNKKDGLESDGIENILDLCRRSRGSQGCSMRRFPVLAFTKSNFKRHLQFSYVAHQPRQIFFYQRQFILWHFEHQLIMNLHD
jgi:hypothetical protein